MSSVKITTTGKCFSAIWIISMAFLVDAAYVKIGSEYPSAELSTVRKPFEDLKVEAVVYSETQRTLTLKISWNPNMTNDSIFRATVNPIEGGLCHHGTCDESGFSYNATLFVPMEPTNSETSHPQCRIDPGCNYTVVVENEREKFESELTYTVPDRVGIVQSCQHKMDLPVVKSVATIESQTMTVRWEINGNYSIPTDISVYIVVIVYDIDDNKNKLKVFNHTLDSPKETSGEFTWNVTASGVDYMTRTSVYDSHNCSGRGNPYPAKAKGKPRDSNKYPTNTVQWLIIAVVSFAVIVVIVWLIFRRKIKREKQTIHKTGVTIVNPTYVPPDFSVGNFLVESDEIPHSDLQLIKIIGQGAFGTVYIARRNINYGKSGYHTVAVKQLKKRPTPEQKEEFFCEIGMMKKVSGHPNIVSLLGYCTQREPLQIVMEYVGCGDLRAYLHKLRARHEERYGRNRVTIPCELNHPLLAPPSGRYLDLMNSSTASTSDSSHATETEGNNRPSVTETMYTTLSNNGDATSLASSLEYVLDHRELHNFARQIAEGMKHLHDMKITHRDLAARNILIDECKTLKISDFGLSRNGIYVNTKNKAVPLRWLSIEAMRDNLYSEKSDVWAFGIVLWEIGALGGHPYHTVSNYNLLSYLSAGNRLEKPENCSDYLYDLMMECWAARTDDRPDFIRIISKLDLHERTYVDFSELSSDYVFPPTKEQIQNNKMSNGLRH